MVKNIILVLLLFSNQNLFSYVVDVVIPCHKKDLRTLELVIEGIKKNVKGVRRIIVVSSERLTNNAEWFDESLYPFSPQNLALIIFNGDAAKATLWNQRRPISWIFQQLLKLYAPIVIPNISENVLIVDADTIFLKKITFIDEHGYALYNTRKKLFTSYVEHIKRLLPDLKIISHTGLSGVCHHILLQRPAIKHLFNEIRLKHTCDPWKALCQCIDIEYFHKNICMSEYELYFNFIFANNYKAKIRNLKSIDIKLSDRATVENKDYDYISCHSYLKSKYFYSYLYDTII